MKQQQNIPYNLNKPPPARAGSYSSNVTRVRGHANVDQATAAIQEMQVQERSTLDKPGGISASSSNVGKEKSPGEKPAGSGVFHVAPKDVADCLGVWWSYLQMLNGLCSAGSRLSHCLQSLVKEIAPYNSVASHCQSMWDELVKATSVASTAVKNEVLVSLQELLMKTDPEADAHQAFDNNEVMCSSLMAFINIQYQFCLACCECLKNITKNQVIEEHANVQQNTVPQQLNRRESQVPDYAGIIQQCFGNNSQPSQGCSTRWQGDAQSSESPVAHPGSGPNPLSPCIFGQQRRWSEVASGELREDVGEGTQRRWSMPAGEGAGSRLQEEDPCWHNTLASQEELQEVIQLLSCRPGHGQSTQLYHPGRHIPGVILTSCSQDGPVESWHSSVSPSGFSWDWSLQHSGDGTHACGRTHLCADMLLPEGRASSSLGLPPRRGSSPRLPPDSQLAAPHHLAHRSSWPAPDLHAQMWGDHEHRGGTETEAGHSGFDLFPPNLSDSSQTSRKSSSSTDSSSSHSFHSRSTTGSEGGAVRSSISPLFNVERQRSYTAPSIHQKQ